MPPELRTSTDTAELAVAFDLPGLTTAPAGTCESTPFSCLYRMPCVSMPLTPRLLDQAYQSRRSIADAVDVLAQEAAFDSTDHARIEIFPLKLPRGEQAWVLCIVYEAEKELLYVPLPCSLQFQAKRDGSSSFEFFETPRLEGATVDGMCQVTLSNGTKLRAIEIVPAIANAQPSDLDYFIVHALVRYSQADQRCYRDPTETLPPKLRVELPHIELLDFNQLHQLEIPLLKQLVGFITDERPDLSPISEQKVADALRSFGLRIPPARPRIARSSVP